MIKTLYQDQDLAVIAKPAGYVVNEAETVSSPTIQAWWREQLAGQSWPAEWQAQVPRDFDSQYGRPEEIFQERHGIVHRLDKETSGAMVLAKHPGSLVELLRQFRERETTKQYTCLVHGKFGVTEDTISLPLARAKHDRQKFISDPLGRPAETVYRVEKFFAHLNVAEILAHSPEAKGAQLSKKMSLYQGFSLVSCWPKTGRTHQIRVHMAALSHPLVGDARYSGKKRAKLDATWCPRHFLHATKLGFIHPRTKEHVEFVCELPTDLQQVLTFVTE